jgi:hypothetical protein
MEINDSKQAEVQICCAIAALGRLAAIDVDLGDGPEDIDANLIQAAYESNFNDPEFLGGPGCFQRARTPADVEALAARTGLVTRGLHRYIATRGGAGAADRAEAELAAIEAAIAWAKQAART